MYLRRRNWHVSIKNEGETCISGAGAGTPASQALIQRRETEVYLRRRSRRASIKKVSSGERCGGWCASIKVRYEELQNKSWSRRGTRVGECALASRRVRELELGVLRTAMAAGDGDGK